MKHEHLLEMKGVGQFCACFSQTVPRGWIRLALQVATIFQLFFQHSEDGVP
jgi:hypothetical protein